MHYQLVVDFNANNKYHCANDYYGIWDDHYY